MLVNLLNKNQSSSKINNINQSSKAAEAKSKEVVFNTVSTNTAINNNYSNITQASNDAVQRRTEFEKKLDGKATLVDKFKDAYNYGRDVAKSHKQEGVGLVDGYKQYKAQKQGDDFLNFLGEQLITKFNGENARAESSKASNSNGDISKIDINAVGKDERSINSKGIDLKPVMKNSKGRKAGDAALKNTKQQDPVADFFQKLISDPSKLTLEGVGKEAKRFTQDQMIDIGKGWLADQFGLKKDDLKGDKILSTLGDVLGFGGSKATSDVTSSATKEGAKKLGEEVVKSAGKEAGTEAGKIVGGVAGTAAGKELGEASIGSAISKGLGQYGAKALNVLGAVYSGYEFATNFGKMDPVTGAINGATTGAYIGTQICPGIGTVIGGVIGGAVGFFNKSFKTGKSAEQIARDKFRESLQTGGILDKDWNIQLADGTKFDIGKDGKARLINLDGTERRYHEVDFRSPLASEAVGLLSPLLSTITGGETTMKHQMVGYLTNAVTASEGDRDTMIRNVLGVYQQFGVPLNMVGDAVVKMANEKLIPEATAQVYLNSLYALDGFSGGVGVQAGSKVQSGLSNSDTQLVEAGNAGTQVASSSRPQSEGAEMSLEQLLGVS